MKIYEKFNKIETALLIPFIFGGILLAAGELLLLVSDKSAGSASLIIYKFSELMFTLIPFVFCYYFSAKINRGKRWMNGSWAVFCLALFITAVCSVYETGIAYFAGIFVSMYLYCALKYIDNKPLAMAVAAVFSVLTGLLIGYLLDYLDNLYMHIAQLVSGKGVISSALFAVINCFFSVFGFSGFSDAFFYKSYGGSMLINNEIITGIKDLFSAGFDGKLVSAYLSGHYYFIFALVGISAALLSDIKGSHKTTLIVLIITTVISGNYSLILLFLLLQCPMLVFSAFLICALAYSSAYIIDLGAGYINNGGIAEMIIYCGKPVYLAAGGVVFIAIGYFVYKYCYEKYGVSDCFNIYIPTRLNGIVSALGGVGNIIRFKNNFVEVRNPKLVNQISLKCEIDENIVKSSDMRIIELKEYYNDNS